MRAQRAAPSSEGAAPRSPPPPARGQFSTGREGRGVEPGERALGLVDAPNEGETRASHTRSFTSRRASLSENALRGQQAAARRNPETLDGSSGRSPQGTRGKASIRPQARSTET